MTIPQRDTQQIQTAMAAIAAAGFNYMNVPANIGADLDPCILKGLQSALGFAAGITAVSLLWGGVSFDELFKYWFGGKGIHSTFGRYGLIVSGIAGTVSCLVVPDNQALQAAAVFLAVVSNSKLAGDY